MNYALHELSIGLNYSLVVWLDTPYSIIHLPLVGGPLGHKCSISNNITTTLLVPINEKSLGECEQLVAKTLNKRLQRVREKRDRLVKERELQRIEDECALLERKTASDVGND
ncbi:hypothetical protein M433DRAFT_9102 [Acidomyces richmondensis BFW]|nr:hypothetical protein M433DRAFT_9102 [Acidomyces richmondensis BFW]